MRLSAPNHLSQPLQFNVEGDIGVTQYCNTVRKIGKYHVGNFQNTDTAFMIGHANVILYPSRVFVISSIYAPAINLSHGKKIEFIIATIEKAGNCVQQQFHN